MLVRRFRPLWLERPHGYATVIAGAALLTLSWDIPQAAKRFQGFVIDDRVRLQEYINRYAPEGSSFAIDEMIHLYPNQIGGRPVERSYFVADIGTLEELRERGITHVAVSYDVYWRYLGHQKPAPGAEALHTRRATFYRRLLEEGEHKFHRAGYHPKPLHPGIMLVDIRGIGNEGESVDAGEATLPPEHGKNPGGS
jgi:hypothetical protein